MAAAAQARLYPVPCTPLVKRLEWLSQRRTRSLAPCTLPLRQPLLLLYQLMLLVPRFLPPHSLALLLLYQLMLFVPRFLPPHSPKPPPPPPPRTGLLLRNGRRCAGHQLRPPRVLRWRHRCRDPPQQLRLWRWRCNQLAMGQRAMVEAVPTAGWETIGTTTTTKGGSEHS